MPKDHEGHGTIADRCQDFDVEDSFGAELVRGYPKKWDTGVTMCNNVQLDPRPQRSGIGPDRSMILESQKLSQMNPGVVSGFRGFSKRVSICMPEIGW